MKYSLFVLVLAVVVIVRVGLFLKRRNRRTDRDQVNRPGHPPPSLLHPRLRAGSDVPHRGGSPR
jgi:hypothetical protein